MKMLKVISSLSRSRMLLFCITSRCFSKSCKYLADDEICEKEQSESHVNSKAMITDENLIKSLDVLEFDKFQHKSSAIKHSTAHGELSVFTLDEIVEVLKDENVYDLYCIKANTQSALVCDYLVFGTCLSAKHLAAVCEYVSKLYKKKKYADDRHVVWGGKESNSWRILDMGRVILHLFSNSDLRKHYDIESLWTFGYELDESYHDFKKTTEAIRKLVEIPEDESS